MSNIRHLIHYNVLLEEKSHLVDHLISIKKSQLQNENQSTYVETNTRLPHSTLRRDCIKYYIYSLMDTGCTHGRLKDALDLQITLLK